MKNYFHQFLMISNKKEIVNDNLCESSKTKERKEDKTNPEKNDMSETKQEQIIQENANNTKETKTMKTPNNSSQSNESNQLEQLRLKLEVSSPSFQELEMFGYNVNYKRFNALFDNEILNGYLSCMLNIPHAIELEIKARKEKGLPTAMQLYGKDIHIPDMEAFYDLRDLGIIVDHTAIEKGTKDKEEEYDKAVEKYIKEKEMVNAALAEHYKKKEK